MKKSVSYWFWFLAVLCAIIPDADVLFRAFGIERGSMLAHRGLTHSIVFAVFFGGLIALLVHKFLKTGISFGKLFTFFALATVSHPLLDMLTDGGPGVALLSPFSSERFFFPFQPIEVSPIGLRFFSRRGLIVIVSELIWVWLPALALLFCANIYRAVKARA